MKVSSNILLLVASVTTNFLVPANATLRNVDLQNNQVAANEEELSNRMLGRKGKGGNKKKNTKKGIGGAGPWVKNDSSSPDTMDLAAALSKIAELEAKLNECETGDDGDEGRGEIPDEPGFVEEGGECNKAAECIQREGGFGVGKLFSSYPHSLLLLFDQIDHISLCLYFNLNNLLTSSRLLLKFVL